MAWWGWLFLGLFVGANVAIIIAAMLLVDKEAKEALGKLWLSDCCDAPVREVSEYKCSECGKFCKVK